MFAIKGTTSFTRRLSRRRAPSAHTQIDQQTPANAARSDDTPQASSGQAMHGIPPPIPAIWKQDNGAPFPSPILNDDVSGLSRASGRDYGFPSSKATDQYLHPLYGNSSRSGAGETTSEADREFLTLTLPTPDTLPTFTAPDWTGETTPKLRTFSLRSSISHTSWKSWNNDRRVDSAHQGPNSERRTFSMRSLSRRLSIRNDVNHRVTVENPQKDLHEITPPSKESDSEQNAQREDAEFLSLLKDSRLTPEQSQPTITPAATAIDHENGGRARPKSIAIHAAARTSTISLALYQPHEDDWVRQIEPTDGTGVDEKCLAIELEDDKIPVIPEEQPICTPVPETITNTAADAPAGLLTSSNLRALDTITADSSPMARAAAKDKDLPDLPLPVYPPTSDGGSSTLSATHRQHQHRVIKHKASTIKKSHHGSVVAAGHHLRHNSAHHARSRSSTTLFLSLVSRRNTVTDSKPPATATASNSNNTNNKNDEGQPPATDRAPTLLSRVPSMLLSRTSTLRTAIRPSSRSRRSALNPYSTKAKPIKPVPLATINRRCEAYSNNDPVQAYILAQERVGAWVATQEELVEWFRKEGRWEEYMRTKREEKERRRMREMEEEKERMACAKWRLRRWLSEDHGSQEGSMNKARQGSVDVDADVVDGMVEWPEEGIWDGFVSGKRIEAEE